MKSVLKSIIFAFAVSAMVWLVPQSGVAQVTSGDIVGVVTDTTGAVVPNADVLTTNIDTGVQASTKTNANGEYRLPNLLPGRYRISVNGQGLKGEVAQVMVRLNQTITANVTAAAEATSTTVEVSAQAAPIDTTTPQIQSTFEAKQMADLPEAATGSGVLNLSLLNAGVASAGGIGVGTGPSVSGQRPRNNNFMIEGVDNNSKSVTGPVVQVPNDAVENFTVLQNQFNPEFGHSSGAQFNQTIKSGTNHFHGMAYEFFQNRNLNAIDANDARTQQPGPFINPRYDNNRFGGNLGGPIVKDKLFFFTNTEYNNIGHDTRYFACAPTSQGYAEIAALGGGAINANNLQQYQKYVGSAASPTGPDCGFSDSSLNTPSNELNDFFDASGTLTGTYHVGEIPVGASNFTNTLTTVNSVDFNPGQSDQIRFRYIYQKQDTQDTAANIPTFWTPIPVRNHIFTLGEFHTFSPTVTNEFRLGYNRNSQFFPVGPQQFPGLDSFPNLNFDDLATQVGPDPNAPQFGIQNVYQATENISWVKGAHNLKFGIEGRKYISPQGFTQRSRGDYEWSNFSQYLLDVVPDVFAQRSTGNNTYYGDQSAIYVYGADSYRVSQNLTLDLGLRYEFTSVPFTERLQTLNSIASAPGVLTFSEPQPQYKNFAPRVGFAYSPGNSGTTSIRGGFGMAYDVLFDNFGLLTVPPEFGGTCDVQQSVNGTSGCAWSDTGFLSKGGLPPGSGSGLKTFASAAKARAATTGYVPNQTLPYTETWDFGVQHSFGGKYTAEIRYVGTRGIHLPAQIQLNKQPKVTPTNFLPTYLSAPTPAQLDALTTTLASIQALSSTLPAYAAAGFTSGITSYQPFGASVYHGLQTQLNRSFTNGLQFQAAWTWSHAEDNSTAEVFSTQLTPRRAQNSQNLAADWGTSALDRRHRVSLELIYDLPFFKNANWFAKNLVGNWEIAPVWQFQTPEYFTAQSITDSNQNGDSAPDRTIFNPAGVPGTGSNVTALTNSAGATVAYLATNPSAQYIKAGLGAFATAQRNTIPLPRTNNWDLTLLKRFNITESTAFEFQAQAFNVFNHSQYIPGYVNDVAPLGYTSITSFVNAANPTQFNRPDLTFHNNARTMQLVAKFSF
ncbi:MAG TPA: carboxypeptidase regulatory-like domain-containing protein [Terriglobales bacterium]|nr:carboxypeptidase regulatory-like domain-containing protein [Terriglobales bacterium]